MAEERGQSPETRLSGQVRVSGLGQITEHLYISNGRAARDRAAITRLRITCVINATLNNLSTHIHPVEVVRVPVHDSPDVRLIEHFDAVADKIHQIKEQCGRTLVHCNAGVSRSAALCIAYLMKYCNMSLLEAHGRVKAQRPIVRPNSGFWKQLIEYENRLYGKNTVRMISSPVGDIPDLYEKETKDLIPY
ncbi:dual specificity protein phosphatase 18 [Chanos chanos]|uniref:Dual specificity protein phosphatase 18 n=1 Tax=Chanos chanos TaxID=29144 RepID=A0A6J2UQA5_CHACN|nr:dual specificity protein phosphatase 18-like [Chanos chanos]